MAKKKKVKNEDNFELLSAQQLQELQNFGPTLYSTRVEEVFRKPTIQSQLRNLRRTIKWVIILYLQSIVNGTPT